MDIFINKICFVLYKNTGCAFAAGGDSIISENAVNNLQIHGVYVF